MSARLVGSIASYEVRRSIARRKVLVIVVFTLLIDTLPYFALGRAGSSIIPAADYPYLWVAGVYGPQSLFIPFMSILIAAGTMAEEYEQGTAELLLSKPVRRIEYFAGKFLGGYVFLLGVIVLNDVLATLSAQAVFGAQSGVQALPGMVVVQTFAATLFFCVAFSVSELLRRSSLSYILSSAAFFSSTIVSLYLLVVYGLTRDAVYKVITGYLPTTPINSLPLAYLSSTLPSSAQAVVSLVSPGGLSQNPAFSAALIAVYSAAALAVSLAHFMLADVTKRSA